MKIPATTVIAAIHQNHIAITGIMIDKTTVPSPTASHVVGSTIRCLIQDILFMIILHTFGCSTGGGRKLKFLWFPVS